MIQNLLPSLSKGFVCWCIACGLLLIQANAAFAQESNRDFYARGSVVGGVEVDANGVLRTAPKQTMDEVGKTMARMLELVPSDLNEPAPIRKISLKKLDETMRAIIEKKEEFPDAIRYLGGLTAIHYLVVVPEEKDVLLVGPAEGWKVDSVGNVVGRTSARPVFRLEDLVTIFRSWYLKDKPTVITCSIDPTPEALTRVAKLGRTFGSVSQQNMTAVVAAMEEAYGMNVVTVQGIPENSRFAKILVAADYKMKRIGLGHEPSLVRGLPSYTSMLTGHEQVSLPRFWLAPNYGTVTHDSKKLTWKLSEVKVKALTDSDFIDSRSSGKATPSGRSDKSALTWCSKMTDNYDALCKVDPVFGDLKNCMELAIAIALIHREGLIDKAGCSLPVLSDNSSLKPVPLPVPKHVPSRATIFRNGRSTGVICGGVEINPFSALEGAKLDSTLDKSVLNKMSSGTWWSK